MKRNIRQGLADLITDSLLQTEAGERAFARGAAYFESGAVTDLVVSDETINARVVGGDEYAVQLWNDGGELGYSCTCPVGDDGSFCKHGVAAGLAWIAGRKAAPTARRHKDDLATTANGWPPPRASSSNNCCSNRRATTRACAATSTHAPRAWPRSGTAT